MHLRFECCLPLPPLRSCSGTHTNLFRGNDACCTSGRVTAATIVNGGRGYLLPPTLTLTAEYGSGAVVVVDSVSAASGTITSVRVVSGGSGYFAAPVVAVVPVSGGTDARFALAYGAGNLCDAREGDCDSDADCLPGPPHPKS